jgi:hypothetical protein
MRHATKSRRVQEIDFTSGGERVASDTSIVGTFAGALCTSEAPHETDDLVRHPRPYPTESLFGYILRLAEENGYPAPFSILALIGIGNHQLRSRRLPLQELARVAHRELGELERFAYHCGHPPQYRLLGRPVARHELKHVARMALQKCFNDPEKTVRGLLIDHGIWVRFREQVPPKTK